MLCIILLKGIIISLASRADVVPLSPRSIIIGDKTDALLRSDTPWNAAAAAAPII